MSEVPSHFIEQHLLSFQLTLDSPSRITAGFRPQSRHSAVSTELGMFAYDLGPGQAIGDEALLHEKKELEPQQASR